MIDIETLGTRPDTIILSIGCALFDKTGIIDSKEFKLDIDNQQRRGRTFSASTLEWWASQSDAAREVLKQDDFALSIEEYFEEFDEWCLPILKKNKQTYKSLKPWGNGASFDITIMEDLYIRHHPLSEKAIPWHFGNIRCHRTFCAFTKANEKVKRVGTHHNAVDDAIHQAKCVIYQMQRSK